MENLKLHLGIIQRIIFAILKCARLFQNALSKIYWSVIVGPALWTVWALCGRRTHSEIKRITLYKEKAIYSVYAFILKSFLKPNAWLNGLKHPYSSYDLLLGWNPSIPLIALKRTKITYSIDVLGREYEDRKGTYPLVDNAVLGTSEECGYFGIVQKTFDDAHPNRVFIECVWLTGEYKGQKFIINWLGHGGRNTNQQTPSSIYFPPQALIWLFEVIISITALAALIGISFHVWKYLKSLYETLVL